ncbi:molybdopterin-dependent oxidoreductase [Herbaspirillum sp. meg3]|uniref:molybdopterin-dependent oxidoreductase n=1 Tax=Herbaspirillum sp. meg3 TaxID=2025949 RepID=UPI000B994744|nr:molybdopterin-dependent oxidoreductase [Herbaspirillum sp. meg3]ASU36912.1 molybdopterin-dependent oxidoreductase [Herbaspirillum sp. meg3]
MKKRQFLAAGLLGMSSVAIAANKEKQAACASSKDAGPVLLTITGAIGAGNRGALDPVLDQMMAKQKLQFNRAHTFDFASLNALPQTTIKPTLEYDSKQHVLSGPLLSDVLSAAGAAAAGDVLLRAVDGYAVQVSMADIRKYRFIVATHLDGKAIPLGGLGPLWAVYEADGFPEIMEKPISARFALCPWGTYHIEAKI